MAQEMEEYLSIGQVLRPQGLHGQVKIRPDTDDPGRFLALDMIYVRDSDGGLQCLNIRKVSVRGSFVYASIGEDQSIEEAEQRRGLELFISRTQAVPLSEYENFIADLIGCAIVDTHGKMIGLQPGSNDVYVIETPEGSLLVPALRHVITQVDVPARLITADAERLGEVSILAD
jgi:16S rRNA processing protein RimM